MIVELLIKYNPKYRTITLLIDLFYYVITNK